MSRDEIQALLDDLQEEALLPHPVRLRDMILRTRLEPQQAVEINREFQEYLTQFGQTQKIAGSILERLAAGERKA